MKRFVYQSSCLNTERGMIIIMFDTNVPLYAVMILTSLIANIIVVVVLSRKYSFSKNEIICLLLYENIGIVGGAKVLTFLQNYRALDGNFDFLTLGFTAYGAVIGAILFLVIFCFQFKKSFKEMFYVFMPSIPLVYAIGKIGCFLAGCCFGVEYSGIGSVTYQYSLAAPPNIRFFPVQLVETICFLGIFVFMMIIHKRNQFDVAKVGVLFILCGLAKFFLDFMRHRHIEQVFSLNQMISVAFIIIGLIMALYCRTKRESRRTPAA